MIRTYCLQTGPPMRWRAAKSKHEKGPGCICHVEWPDDEKGDLILEVQRQKREWRNEWAKWHRRVRWLAKKRAAPQFQQFLDKARKDHAALEPKFSFSPPTASPPLKLRSEALEAT